MLRTKSFSTDSTYRKTQSAGGTTEGDTQSSSIDRSGVTADDANLLSYESVIPTRQTHPPVITGQDSKIESSARRQKKESSILGIDFDSEFVHPNIT